MGVKALCARLLTYRGLAVAFWLLMYVLLLATASLSFLYEDLSFIAFTISMFLWSVLMTKVEDRKILVYVLLAVPTWGIDVFMIVKYFPDPIHLSYADGDIVIIICYAYMDKVGILDKLETTYLASLTVMIAMSYTYFAVGKYEEVAVLYYLAIAKIHIVQIHAMRGTTEWTALKWFDVLYLVLTGISFIAITVKQEGEWLKVVAFVSRLLQVAMNVFYCLYLRDERRLLQYKDVVDGPARSGDSRARLINDSPL
jgi:hypothetical protein